MLLHFFAARSLMNNKINFSFEDYRKNTMAANVCVHDFYVILFFFFFFLIMDEKKKETNKIKV